MKVAAGHGNQGGHDVFQVLKQGQISYLEEDYETRDNLTAEVVPGFTAHKTSVTRLSCAAGVYVDTCDNVETEALHFPHFGYLAEACWTASLVKSPCEDIRQRRGGTSQEGLVGCRPLVPVHGSNDRLRDDARILLGQCACKLPKICAIQDPSRVL